MNKGTIKNEGKQTNKQTNNEQTHIHIVTCSCCIVNEAERSHSCDACFLQLFRCHGFQRPLSDLLPGEHLRVALCPGCGEAH